MMEKGEQEQNEELKRSQRVKRKENLESSGMEAKVREHFRKRMVRFLRAQET